MKMNRQVPVEKGKTYTIEIKSLGSNGEGIGRYEDFTVFVPFALPKETVEARIEFVKKQYATGTLLKILEPAKDRVKPLCPVYNRCGGCQLQHLSYSAELMEKQQQVKDALERIGHLKNLTVLPTLGGGRSMGLSQ
ncbi:TRAM domain-containing protein [Megasphaera paucivorans]|uniref:TRAM domain-containing protein n=1 Tax=Megasphaera paucivorans TaxID=349095 RepID=A0A1G9UEJ0_9FIRM|nr:TRAM domain-containing protein [Megasphaera paucivorans]